ncbi:MAG: hypothetical protein QGG40_17305 [Myxococcota bacterium]|nr:hypothetical protein [Myxococcota bacterium]
MSACTFGVCLLLVLYGCGEPDTAPDASGDARPEASADREPAGETSPFAPDMVLFLVPGLRADFPDTEGAAGALLGAFRGTPSVRVTRAYAQSSDSFPSLASILTGRYPSAIPLCGLTPDGRDDPSARPWCAQVPDSVPVLPEVLGLYGYRSAWVSGGVPGAELLSRGFDLHRDLPDDLDVSLEAPALAEPAVSWWAANPDRPRLLVIVPRTLDLERRTDLDLSENWEQTYLSQAQALGEGLSALLSDLAPSIRPRLVAVLGISGMTLNEGAGFEKNTVQDYSRMLLERTLHVPLVLYLDRVGTPVVRETRSPVELLDLFPTLAQVARARPPAGLPGADLLSRRPADLETAYSEFGDMLALRMGPYLLTFRGFLHHASALDPGVTGRLIHSGLDRNHYGLHAVEEDPLQTTNAVQTNAIRAGKMRQKMLEIRTGAAAPPSAEFTPEQLWELRMSEAQGYW